MLMLMKILFILVPLLMLIISLLMIFSAFGKQTYVYDTFVDAFSVFGIFFDVF